MVDLATGEDFLKLFRDFHHTAFRLEVRTAYGIPEEDEPFRDFLAGRQPPISWFRPWLSLMEEQTAQGKRVERVRLIDEPPSDYLRFELWGTPYNLAAGEDIRYLRRAEAAPLALPEHDFWLFDSRLVARLQFGDRDRFLGVTLSEDPEDALRHVRWRDAAWSRAQTLHEYERETVERP
ncbi:DUF6879 family protein [Streptomyces sp. NPDC054796]